MSSHSLTWDVLIIGSGAGGGAMAHRLCERGLRVLVLEKGPQHQSADYRHDELSMLHDSFFTPDPALDPHMVVTQQTTRAVRHKLGWSASCVGGGTEHMGAYLYRFHPDDFRMRSVFGDYAELCDWPITYADLEPYYQQADQLLGMAGNHSADHHYAPRQNPYPLPELRSHPIAQVLEQACQQHGWQASATPRAVNSQPYANHPACSYCQHCGGYGCPSGARGSSWSRLLKPAVTGALNAAGGMVEVRAQCMVRRVLLDSDSANASHTPKVSGCEYFDHDGEVHSVHAHTVVLACSAVETARLLLLSANERFPQGLANSSGKVGRHLQFHGVTMGWAEWRNEGNTPAVRAALTTSNSPFIGRSLYDFYHLPAHSAPIGHGGILRFSRASPEPITDAQAMALSSARPRWGAELVADLQHFYRRHYRMAYEVFHGFIPNRDTHVSLDPSTTDHHGLPSARISLAVDPHQRACGDYIAKQAEAIFKTMGASNMGRSVSGGTTWHLAHGTCRASHDPRQGVVNAEGQSHDIANLFVADASYMPSNGAAPPTLTIVANALRISDYICSDDYKEKRDK